MMKKLLGNKRGVSPVVADLLMVFITVAAFSIMYGISNQWINLQRANQMQTITERIVIEDAWFFTPKNNTMRLTITNVGKIDIKVRYVQINEIVKWGGTGETPVNVLISETLSLFVTLNWAVDTNYRIRVITDRGNWFEAVFVSPSQV